MPQPFYFYRRFHLLPSHFSSAKTFDQPNEFLSPNVSKTQFNRMRVSYYPFINNGAAYELTKFEKRAVKRVSYPRYRHRFRLGPSDFYLGINYLQAYTSIGLIYSTIMSSLQLNTSDTIPRLVFLPSRIPRVFSSTR